MGKMVRQPDHAGQRQLAEEAAPFTAVAGPHHVFGKTGEHSALPALGGGIECPFAAHIIEERGHFTVAEGLDVPVDGDAGKVLGADAGGIQAVADGVAGVNPVGMLLTDEALFLGKGDELAIAYNGGSRVGVTFEEAEIVHGLGHLRRGHPEASSLSLRQRAAAWSSLSRASTQRGPLEVSSCFQKGALVFSQSIRN